jgi:hypothetical protein
VALYVHRFRSAGEKEEKSQSEIAYVNRGRYRWIVDCFLVLGNGVILAQRGRKALA